MPRGPLVGIADGLGETGILAEAVRSFKACLRGDLWPEGQCRPRFRQPIIFWSIVVPAMHVVRPSAASSVGGEDSDGRCPKKTTARAGSRQTLPVNTPMLVLTDC